MEAIAIVPGKGSAHLIEVEEPSLKSDNDVKIEVLEVGICGTDREQVSGGRADPPAGASELIIGHEMIGRVVAIGKNVSRVKIGDYALFMVRRPCGHCLPCSNNRSDLCSSGDYTERGIKGIHGYQSQFVVDREEYVIPVPKEISDIGVLAEPMSVVIKAVEESLLLQSARFSNINAHNWLSGKKALVAGLGPVGLLAAFILGLNGARIYGLDILEESSLRASILKEIGGTYINGLEVKTDRIDNRYGEMDFIIEATGISKLEFELIDALGPNGIYVLIGIPAVERLITIAGGELIQQMVLKNQIMFGTVNAGINHYFQAIEALIKIKTNYNKQISKIITKRVNYRSFKEVLEIHSPEEIKAIVEWSN